MTESSPRLTPLQTAPNKKLPALYVLDMIVKTVGTPYTVYLGRNLYSTFMDAYTLVDSMTRRQMDNLLKTWKEPIPNSIDRNPVFPPEVTRPIENALIKARTAALGHQQRATPQMMQRPNGTPPQFNGQFAPPSTHQQYQQPPYPQLPQWQPAYQTPTPQPQQAYPQPPQPQYPVYPSHAPQQQPQYTSSTPVHHPAVDVEAVRADIASLISRLQAQFAANPNERRVLDPLQALLDLQKLMDAGVVKGENLEAVKDRVSKLAASAYAPPTPVPQAVPQSAQQWQPPQATPLPFQPSYQPPAVAMPAYQQPAPTPLPYSQPPAAALAQSQPPLLAPDALSGLQALLSGAHKSSTPQIRAAAPALANASHDQLRNVQNSVAAAPPANTADLLAALAKSGIIGGAPTASAPPVQAPATAPFPAQSTASLLQSLSSILPASQRVTPTLPPDQLANTGKPRIPLSATALKTFRPELVRALYDDQPNQCSTCGRRFLATEEGRAKKERHLDWHFRTNQRMADPNATRGQHRQWFVDEVEWISIQEFDPSTASAADAANGAAAARKKQRGPADKFLRAPAGVTRLTCAICQEEMKSSYSEELQDWVFMNAVYYNGKPAHATCVEEMTRPSAGGAGALAAALAGGGRQRSATPESTLGKRKADGALAGTGARVKMG